MQNIALVFWYVVGTAVINNMLKIHDNIPHIKGVIATRVKHKCTGKLEVFITTGGGHWRCSRLSPVCPRAPIESIGKSIKILTIWHILRPFEFMVYQSRPAYRHSFIYINTVTGTAFWFLIPISIRSISRYPHILVSLIVKRVWLFT